jgi:hypothetical protein
VAGTGARSNGAGSNGAGSNGASGRARPRPGRQEVQRRFRELLRDAHPDHGGDAMAAATRIAELSEARRILLAG